MKNLEQMTLEEHKKNSESFKVAKCQMSDGPFCGAMDKYYTHSRSLYESTESLKSAEQLT